jgi:hypothetical protein
MMRGCLPSATSASTFPAMSLIYSPGPAAYDLGSGIGRAPAATMKGRPKQADTSLSPGPGSCRLEGYTGREGPKFTLRPKTNVPADLTGTPGPDAYDHDTHKGKGPKITMAPKLNLARRQSRTDALLVPVRSRQRRSEVYDARTRQPFLVAEQVAGPCCLRPRAATCWAPA